MTYKEHRKGLLKDKTVRAEYEKLLPEYELTRSIIEQRLRKKMTQGEMVREQTRSRGRDRLILGSKHRRACRRRLGSQPPHDDRVKSPVPGWPVGTCRRRHGCRDGYLSRAPWRLSGCYVGHPQPLTIPAI